MLAAGSRRGDSSQRFLERIEWSSSWSLAVSLYYVLTLSIELDLSGIEAAFRRKLWPIACSAKLVMP